MRHIKPASQLLSVATKQDSPPLKACDVGSPAISRAKPIERFRNPVHLEATRGTGLAYMKDLVKPDSIRLFAESTRMA